MEAPKPFGDTGIGVHNNPDYQWKPADPYAYADDLWNHGVRWYLGWIADENKADFIHVLRQKGIEVIIRPGRALMPTPRIDIVSQIEAYIDVGVNYFVLGNEYNLWEEWDSDGRPPWKHLDKPLRHQAEWYVRMAAEVSKRGAWPLTPPPSLGGHMNHREWFGRFMWAIHNMADERGVPMIDLLQPGGRGGIGLHCRSCGNPLNANYTMYDCSADEWRWFADCVKSHVGVVLPMANTEAFDQPDWLPKVGSHYDWNLWKQRNIEQYHWFNPDGEGYKYPKEILCNTFWVIHADRFSPWPQCGLYSNHPHYLQRGDWTTDLWKEMPNVVTWERDENAPPPPPPPPPPELKLRVYDAAGEKKDLAWAQGKYGVRLNVYNDEGWHVTQMRERVNCSNAVEMYLYRDSMAAQGVNVQFHWPDGCDCDKVTEVGGKIGFVYSSGAWIWDASVGGPHWIVVKDGNAPADGLSGLGMKAMTNHDHLDFVWSYGVLEGATPTEPLDVILPLAEGLLKAIPVPADWAYPKKAAENGCRYQVGGYDQVEIDNRLWGYQTFTNDDQSRYGVAYSPEGEYDKTAWAWIERN